MPVKKNILFVILLGTTTHLHLSVHAQPDQETPQVCQEPEKYPQDDFDAIADDMIDHGVVAQEEIHSPSTLARWAQQIASAVIMKYVLVKGYLRTCCYWISGVQRFQG